LPSPDSFAAISAAVSYSLADAFFAISFHRLRSISFSADDCRRSLPFSSPALISPLLSCRDFADFHSYAFFHFR